MANDWMLDVLADLKRFAEKNGLQKTAEQLDDATLVAMMELSATEGGQSEGAALNEGSPGYVY